MGFIIILVFFLGIPVVLTVLNLVNLYSELASESQSKNLVNLYSKLDSESQFKRDRVDESIMILGPILTVLLFSMTNNITDYDQPSRQLHTPLASWHLPTIFILGMLGLIGYRVIRKFELKLSPLKIVMCISCMIIGSVMSFLWIIQLLPNLFTSDIMAPCWPLLLCIFPFNYIICCYSITHKVIREYTFKEQEKYFKNPILNRCELLLLDSKNWNVIAIVLLIPILTITLMILIFFGQQPSAFIKAFTETSDWLLSMKISPPPPVEVKGHYLCTVSLRGHRNVVKPLRYGIRHNKKIVVNRQLCIANAFEQLIQEKVPKTHRLIRYIYDKYGYPLSKHIISPVSADIVYIFMKPLEWLFLAIIYLVDNKPEDRIAIQYLPL